MPRNSNERKITLPKMYRNIALLFIITTIFGIFCVGYFVFGKARIIITPAFQKISSNSIVTIKDVSETGAPDSALVRGKIYEFEIEETLSAEVMGSKIILDEGIGSVTLVNNYSQDQALVATTRLLASDGTLLRLQEKVLVPKGGKVSARVYPDKPEQFTELKPTKLLIPGLWKDLQDKIFAEVTDTLKKGGRKVSIVSEQDISGLEKKILEKIDEKAVSELKKKLIEEESSHNELLQKEIFQKEILEKNISGSVGEERKSIDARAKAKIIAIVFDEISIINLMKKNLSSTLSAGKELTDIDPESLTYSVDKLDGLENSANIKVYAEGKASVVSENNIFDKARILGLSEQDVINHFKEFREVEGVEIKFFPSWLKRIPRLEDRVTIEIL